MINNPISRLADADSKKHFTKELNKLIPENRSVTEKIRILLHRFPQLFNVLYIPALQTLSDKLAKYYPAEDSDEIDKMISTIYDRCVESDTRYRTLDYVLHNPESKENDLKEKAKIFFLLTHYGDITFEGQNRLKPIEDVSDLLEKLPVEKRNYKTVSKYLSVLTGLNTPLRFYLFKAALELISENDRAHSFEYASKIAEITEKFMNQPPNAHMPSNQILALLTSDYMVERRNDNETLTLCVPLFDWIYLVHPENRIDFIRMLLPYLKQLPSQDHHTSFMKGLFLFSYEKQRYVISDLLSLKNSVDEGTWSKITGILRIVNSQQRLGCFLAFTHMPPEKCKNTLNALLPLLVNKSTEHMSIILKGLGKVQPENREDAIKRFLALREQLPILNNIKLCTGNLIHILGSAKQQDWDNVLFWACYFKFQDTHEVAILVDLFLKMSFQHRKFVVNIFEKNRSSFKSTMNFINFCYLLSCYPRSHRDNLPINDMIQLINKDNYRLHSITIRKILMNLPNDQKARALRPLTSLIKDVFNKDLLSFLLKVPQHELLEILEHVNDKLNRFPDGTVKNIFLISFNLVPPHCLKTFIDKATSLNPEPFREVDILKAVFDVDSQIKNDTHLYLQNILHSEPNPHQAKYLANFIYSEKAKLCVAEDSALNLTANHVLYCTARLNERKCPYRVHSGHVHLSRLPTPNLDMPQEKVGEETLVINRQGFIDKLQQCPQITYRDLPPDFKPNDFINLFNDMEYRVDNLSSPDDQNKTAAEICSITSANFKQLAENITTDPYIRKLTSQPSHPDTPAKDDAVAIAMILKFIKDKPDEFKEGSALTCREQQLLKTSVSIQGCPAGKKEMIFALYNKLPSNYKLKKNFETDSYKKGSAFTWECLTETLSDVLSSDKTFMQKLTELEEDNQISHNSTYTKNLIANRVGLKHQLVFDLYAGMLADPLIDKSLSEVLHIFYNYVTPRFLIKKLTDAVNRNLEGTKLYNNLNAIFEEAGVKESEVWELNDDCTFSFTESGAAVILKALGYITSLKK